MRHAETPSDWVRERRRALGLTQTALGARAGVSLATIQNLEAGRANPSLSTLARILAPLGLAIRVAPVPADWEALVALGLPLSRPGPAPRPVTSSEWPELIRRAAHEVAAESPREDAERRREALQALLWALRSHFPTLYLGWFEHAPEVGGMLPAAPSGRVIKLARVARRMLAEVL